MSMEKYIESMRGSAYGDHLMITKMAQIFAQSIAVISVGGARTFSCDEIESPGALPDAAWVAHLDERHYFGVIRAGQPGEGERERWLRRQRHLLGQDLQAAPRR